MDIRIWERLEGRAPSNTPPFPNRAHHGLHTSPQLPQPPRFWGVTLVVTRGGPRGRDERPRDHGRARPPLLTYAVWLTYAVAGVLEVVGGGGSRG